MNTDLFGLIESNYFDVAIIILVVCSGFLVKRFWTQQGKLCTAWRTLIISSVLIVIYTVIMLATHELHPTYWAKCFVSYTVATSFYELILKKLKSWNALK